MKTALGSIAFIVRCSLPLWLWVRWHSSTKTKTSPTVWLGFQLLDERVEVVYIPPAELVDERAQQARFSLTELAHQVVATTGAVDSLSRLGEDPLDLFVQLIAVGDDGYAPVGVVLQNPPGQQHHDDALAAA